MDDQDDMPGITMPRVPPDRQETKGETEQEVIDVATPPPQPEEEPTGSSQVAGSPPEGQGEGGTSGSKATSRDEQREDKTEGKTIQKLEEKEDPLIYDDADMEELSFTEMHAFLVDQMRDQTLSQAVETERETEYLQIMFEEVFAKHPEEFLPPARRRYPALEQDEVELIVKLFLIDINEEQADARKWRARLQEMVRAIYKSRSSLSEMLDVLVKSVQAKPAPAVNPWSKRLFPAQNQEEGTEDIEMTEGKPSIYRFLQSAFSSEQIKELRQTCEIRYGFPSHLRKPTEIESTIIRGLLEGTILCPRLPDFLKRICDPQAYRKIQNTIKAQVEGDLILKLYPEFKIYPQFQTRKRLTREFLLGINNSSNDPAKVTAMLQEAKQICYDQGQHAIHLIFWTREMASKWSKEFTVLNFRNRRFPVRNAHEAEYGTPIDSEDRSKVIWGRQVGADGIRNELPRDRYHVRLLNLSRYLDEAAIDAYIQTQFQGVYHTWQEPTTVGQIPQTDTWDIFFRCNHCPQFLDGIRFINWEDTKILVHHVTRNAASPCFSCGANGHMRTVCKVSDDFWKSQYSLRVMAEDIEALPRQQSTITSVEELEQLWTKDQQDTNTVMKTEIANQQVDKKSTKQILKRKDNCSTGLTLTQQPDNEWKTAGKHNGKSKILGTEDPSTYRTEVEEDGGNARKTDSGEDGKQTFGTDAGKAQVEAQGPRGIGRTITEEIHRATRDSSSAMMKQKELMEKLIGEKREKTEEGVYDACLHIDVEKYPNEAVSGLQVLQDCGLEQVLKKASMMHVYI